MNSDLFYDIAFISSLLLPLFSPGIITYLGVKAYKHYKSNYILKQNSELKNIDKVMIPEDLKKKYDDVEIEETVSEEIKEVVLEFTKVLIDKFPEDVLVNFYNNVNEAAIDKDGILCFFLKCVGFYSIEHNEIYFVDINSLYHELFHLASSYYDEKTDTKYTGFNQLTDEPSFTSNSASIGIGINEGYTELLAHRYFGEKHPMTWAYLFEVGVAKRIEEIVGQDKMEKLYLTANLKGLIEELKQYISAEEISGFMTTLDFLSTYRDKIVNQDIIKNKITEVYSFIFKAYVGKLRYQFINDLISYEEYENSIEDYLASFGTKLKLGDVTYEYFPNDDILEYLNEIGYDAYEVFDLNNNSNRLVA